MASVIEHVKSQWFGLSLFGKMVPDRTQVEVTTSVLSVSITSISNSVSENANQSNASGCNIVSHADFQSSQVEIGQGEMMEDKNALKTPKNINNNVQEVNLNEKVEKEYVGIKRYLGMILAVASSLSLSLVNLIAKVLPEHGFDAYGISYWRYVGIGLPAIPILLLCEYRLRRTNCDIEKENNQENSSSIFNTVWPIRKNWKTWIALIIRGIIGSTSAILRFLALKYLTVGDTAVIAYSSPALVTILAHFFLGEKCGVIPVLVSFTTIVGVAVVAKPQLFTGADNDFDTDTIIGICLACGSMICAALMVLITRSIREVHFALMLLVFGVIGVAQAVIMSYSLGHGLDFPVNITNSLLTLGVALFSFLGQMGVILAVKFEKAGPVALLRSNDVIFSFILQFIFLGVAPGIYSILGAFIVLVGVFVMSIRKWVATLPPQSRKRKYVGWVLY